LPEYSSTLNASQRQHLLITCKHIDRMLEEIAGTLNAAASQSVFPNYASDITPEQRKTIEQYVARIRSQLLQVLARESLAPEKPQISTAHAVDVALTLIEIAIAELAPHYMQGYGPVSQAGADDLHDIMAQLLSVSTELHRFVQQLSQQVRMQSVADHE
jgi:hypothetical protein